MKVKDLPPDTPVEGVLVKIPKDKEDTYGEISGNMYLYSSWHSGVWLKKNMDEDRIYPLCVDPQEILDWEVVK